MNSLGRWPRAAVWVVSVGLAGCFGGAPSAGPPRGAAKTEPLPVSDSIAVFSLRIPKETLENSLDETVPRVFAEVQGEQVGFGFTLDYRVARGGRLGVAGEGETAVITVPMSIDASAKGPLGGRFALDGAMDVVLRQRMALTDDWRMATSSSLSYRWTRPMVLTKGRNSVDVSRQVDKKLGDRMAAASREIDAKGMATKNLRSKVDATWAKLHAPIPLQGGRAWLVIEPTGLVASSPRWDGGDLLLNTGVTGAVRVVFGEQPPVPVGEIRPLPPRVESPTEPMVLMDVPVELGWVALGEAISPALAASPIEVPGSLGTTTVTVDRVEAWPSGERVAVALDLTVAVAGGLAVSDRVYLLTRPELDEATQTLTLAQLEVAGGGQALDAALWASSGALLAALGDRTTVPLGERLEAARVKVNEALRVAEPDPDRAVIPSGQVDRIRLRGVMVHDEALVVACSLEGQLALEVVRGADPLE